MARWVALLRGINVGGRNILPMRELTATLEQAGCRNVRTYIQSGNVVFDSAHRSAPAAARRVREAIESRHGLEPLVLVMSVDDLVGAAARNPFPEAERVPRSLHLYFLESAPASESAARLARLRSGSERFSAVGNVVYLHTPEGFANSRLAKGVEQATGVGATARNWQTVGKLIDLARRSGEE